MTGMVQNEAVENVTDGVSKLLLDEVTGEMVSKKYGLLAMLAFALTKSCA